MICAHCQQPITHRLSRRLKYHATCRRQAEYQRSKLTRKLRWVRRAA